MIHKQDAHALNLNPNPGQTSPHRKRTPARPDAFTDTPVSLLLSPRRYVRSVHPLF